MDIVIRLAIPGDAEAIASVLLQSFSSYRPLYTPEGFTATVITRGEVLSRMREGPIWVAVFEDMVVGTASAVKRGDSLYIRGMAVLPAKRGARIGESLLGQLQQFATQEGCGRLFLSTTPFLDRAIKLYETFGFRRTDEGPQDLFGTPLFTMEKILRMKDQG